MSKTKIVKPIKVECYTEASNQKTIVALCPACWNKKIGRAFLTAKLKNTGYKVINGADSLDGIYTPNLSHLIGCPNELIFNNGDI